MNRNIVWESVCFNINSINSFCLPPKIFNELSIKVKNELNLDKLPTQKEIINYLDLTEANLDKKISLYLSDNKLIKHFKIYNVVPINKYGLEEIKLKEFFNRLEIIYPDFKYGKMIGFTDMENIPNYNYFDFNLYPPFSKNNKYYIPFLNISSDENVGHWTGIYCSLDKGIVYYYDSLNRDIKKTYKKLIDKIVDKMKKIKQTNNIIVRRNNKQTQYYNAYCGVYQMYFLACCLNFDKAIENKEVFINKLNEHINEDLGEDLIEQYITKMFFYSN